MKGNALRLVTLLAVLTPVPCSANDWYVRAGSRGDGTKAKPFGSVSDALLVANPGDVIHIAKGTYYGKAGTGLWLIDKPNLILAGGYAEDFAERHPIRHPTLLTSRKLFNVSTEAFAKTDWVKEGLIDNALLKADYNAKGMIVGSKNHDGTVLDGLWIVGHTRNAYDKWGSIRLAQSNRAPSVTLSGAGCRIRNCVIVNSYGPAVQMAVSNDESDPKSWCEISNSWIVNTCGFAVDLRQGTRGKVIIRDNTFAFAWFHPDISERSFLLLGRNAFVLVIRNLFAHNQASPRGGSSGAIHNAYNNDRVRLIGNAFFANRGGVYYAPGMMAVLEDPALLSGGPLARKKYFISSKSANNFTADPGFEYDPEFLRNFDLDLGLFLPAPAKKDKEGEDDAEKDLEKLEEGGGKKKEDDKPKPRALYYTIHGFRRATYAPSKDLRGAGAKVDGIDGRFPSYSSRSTAPVAKKYRSLSLAQAKAAARGAGTKGVPVRITIPVGNKDMSGYFAPPGKADRNKGWRCFRHASDLRVFIYVKDRSDDYALMERAQKNRGPVIVKGTAYPTPAKIPNGIAVVADRIETESDD